MCAFVVRVNGVQELGGEEMLVQLSHATQERMRDIVEKLTEISQHRVQTLKVHTMHTTCPVMVVS